MNTERLQDWLQTVGLGGVIVSLIFVGLQIQQSRQIAVADIYQQRTALVMQAQTSSFSPEQWQAAARKQMAGQELDELENLTLMLRMAIWFSYHENTHFQNQIGLLSDEHWETGRNHIQFLTRSEWSRQWWENSRGIHRKSFADEVDRIIREESAEQ